MSHASLKEQLQAVASQLSDTDNIELRHQSKKKFTSHEKPNKLKPKWLDYVQYGVELLKVYFPASFKNPTDVQPLKKGIKEDLVKRLSTMDGIVIEDKACMVKSLAYYVNTTTYHKSVIEGASRIDLDGNSTGPVTAQEAKYSIERYQLKLQAKKNNKSSQNTTECNK